MSAGVQPRQTATTLVAEAAAAAVVVTATVRESSILENPLPGSARETLRGPRVLTASSRITPEEGSNAEQSRSVGTHSQCRSSARISQGSHRGSARPSRAPDGRGDSQAHLVRSHKAGSRRGKAEGSGTASQGAAGRTSAAGAPGFSQGARSPGLLRHRERHRVQDRP